MDTITNLEIKQRKYMPVFPRANGKTTTYIEGYPCEDDEPMAETDFHAEQIITLSDQLKRYFAVNELVHIAVDSFIYYQEGDITKCVAPDIYIVLGLINTHYVAVSILGQKEQHLWLFLSFYQIQQRVRIGIRKLSCI